jgi:hypothetical protein
MAEETITLTLCTRLLPVLQGAVLRMHATAMSTGARLLTLTLLCLHRPRHHSLTFMLLLSTFCRQLKLLR